MLGFLSAYWYSQPDFEKAFCCDLGNDTDLGNNADQSQGRWGVLITLCGCTSDHVMRSAMHG